MARIRTPEATSVSDTRSDEQKTLAWRLEKLLDAGFRQDHAELLAVSPVDLHRAIRLITSTTSGGLGCEPSLAYDILR